MGAARSRPGDQGRARGGGCGEARRRDPPGLFGVFFEDINFAADGGLYPERIKNRLVRVPRAAHGVVARRTRRSQGTLLAIERRQSSDGANRHYLRITADAAGAGFGAANEGFRGIGVAAGERHRLSHSGPAGRRRSAHNPRDARRTRRAGACDRGFWRASPASGATSPSISTPAASDVKATFALLLTVPGAVEVDTVSLFPRHTWKDRPGGLRADLVQLLDGLKPGFIRFPGGCIVEGRHLETRYQWKTTIGPVDERRLIVNRWNDGVRAQGARLLPVVRPRVLRVLPAQRGPRRRSRCRSSTAAWPASSTRASSPRWTARPVHPGRARPHRVRQRAGDDPVGSQAR